MYDHTVISVHVAEWVITGFITVSISNPAEGAVRSTLVTVSTIVIAEVSQAVLLAIAIPNHGEGTGAVTVGSINLTDPIIVVAGFVIAVWVADIIFQPCPEAVFGAVPTIRIHAITIVVIAFIHITLAIAGSVSYQVLGAPQVARWGAVGFIILAFSSLASWVAY